MTPYSARKLGIVGLSIVCGSIAGLSGTVLAADERTKEAPGVVDQIGTTVKSAAATIEREITGVVKKLEDSETSKKVGAELKRSAEALGEKVEQAGEKLKKSFKSE